MKIAVVGLWHQGVVAAACLSHSKHSVVAYDTSRETIEGLKKGDAPVVEPEMKEMLLGSIREGRIDFTTEEEKIQGAEVIWVAYDTPVDENDRADIDYVFNGVAALFPYIAKDAVVLVSAQVPVGSTKKLEELFRSRTDRVDVRFAYSPENLRLGQAVNVFMNPDRFVIGVRDNATKQRLDKLFQAFVSPDKLLWMGVESAEMTKHAINAFLATSVTFANEIAKLCEFSGADAKEVEKGLKTEQRIGSRAYVGPGDAFSGGTLARDLAFLIEIGERNKAPTALFHGVRQSNDLHKSWVCNKVTEILGSLKDKTIGVLGLTYKPGTNTLRRSQSIEMCRALAREGAKVVAFDPMINHLPVELAESIRLAEDVKTVFAQSEVVVVATRWPEFGELTPEQVLHWSKAPVLIDSSRFMPKSFYECEKVKVYSIGKGV